MDGKRPGTITSFMLGLVCDVLFFIFVKKMQPNWIVNGEEIVFMIWIPFGFMAIYGLNMCVRPLKDSLISFNSMLVFTFLLKPVFWFLIICIYLLPLAPLFLMGYFPDWRGIVITIVADIFFFIIAGYFDD